MQVDVGKTEVESQRMHSVEGSNVGVRTVSKFEDLLRLGLILRGNESCSLSRRYADASAYIGINAAHRDGQRSGPRRPTFADLDGQGLHPIRSKRYGCCATVSNTELVRRLAVQSQGAVKNAWLRRTASYGCERPVVVAPPQTHLKKVWAQSFEASECFGHLRRSTRCA